MKIPISNEGKYSLGLIGYGYWGPILLRNLHSHPQIRVRKVCDRNPEKLEHILGLYPDCSTCHDSSAVLEDPEVDIVAIATQARSHFELTERALLRGKHVFVEKPFTLDLSEARRLIGLAREKNRILMVDHPHIFQTDHEVVKRALTNGGIGHVLHYHSTRADFGLFQKDTNVIWHTFYHDVYILLDLFPGYTPAEITASGFSHIVPGVEDTAVVSIRFEENLSADFVASWLFPQKERKIIIAGDRKIIYWDYTAREKVKLFQKAARFDRGSERVTYFPQQGGEALPCGEAESLRVEVDHLVDCLNQGRQPRNNGESAVDVMRILLRIDDVMRMRPGGSRER